MVAGLIARSEAPAHVPSTAPSPARGAALSLRDVRHAFALKKAPLPVLDGVSFDAEPGAFVALLGPSGCGKSTLLRLVAGLEPPNEGRISVDGVPLRGPHPSRGLVFQDPTLYPWRSVIGNVAVGPEARGRARAERGQVEEALALVGLSGFADDFPHQLSGGMAQRVALARALVNAPPLLLLDEPLGKLDSLTRLAMQAELVRPWQDKGFTALLVTHDVEEALMLAQRVLVFSDRPARIRADLSFDRPYPRHREDPGVVADRRAILDLLGTA